MDKQKWPTASGDWTPYIALATAFVLMVLGIGIIVYGTHASTAQEIRSAGIQARILASTVTAALAFEDAKSAREYVNALASSPNVQIAAIYDAGGNLFVSYARGKQTAALTLPTDNETVADNRLSVVTPVAQGGRRLGSVYLQTIVLPPFRRFVGFGLIALLVTMASLVIGVLGVAQRRLAGANLELTSRASALASTNLQLQEQIKEREKVEEALRQSQKMEAIGQLTGGVAHDFNNLLQIILGSLQLLRRRAGNWNLTPESTQDFNRLLDAATKGGERAAVLTRQLLAFSRRQPLAPKVVNVNRLVSGMSDLLRRTLGEAIAIEAVLAGGLWPVHSDPNQLESALLNLALNARDAMPNGGKLSIETANAFLDEAYVYNHEDVHAGQYVVIAVTDTGCGMTRDTIDRAFEPFFTTKDVGHGTGLGLSQVYGFVRQSGGHIKIYSEEGEGTTVKIYLPRHTLAEEETQLERLAEVAPRAGTGETILVVEDEEQVRAASVEMLRELGYTVFQAQDARVALEVLQREPGIELLFTDVGLPGGLDGRQLADAARQLRPALKVLFTTGYARNAIVHHGRLDPGVALISKPFTYAVLAQKIREALRAPKI